jgi:hypothetical protein
MGLPQEYRSSIVGVIDYLIACDLLLDSNIHTVVPGSSFQRLTWRGGAETGEMFRSNSSSLESYFSWLEARAYSFLLVDCGVVQFTYDFDKSNGLVGHRLAYIPCPFDADPDLLREFAVAEVLRDLVQSNLSTNLRLRASIRFDYDPNAAREDHPETHLTLNADCCRIPVCAPLSVKAFVNFIFRSFYPQIYAEHEFFHDFAPDRHQRITLTTPQSEALHVSWRRPL